LILHNTRALRVARVTLLLVVLCLFNSCPLTAQQRPLLTQEAEVVTPKEILVQVGFEFLQDAQFPLSGLTGDLTRVGALAFHLGMSRSVEIQVEGTVRNFLSVTQQRPAFILPTLQNNGTATNDFGELTLATKLKLLPERGKRPAVGLRFGVELPTTDERRGLGLNTTNAFAAVLVQKHFGRVNTFGHAGVAILEAPAGLFSQNDVLLLGWAFVLSVHERLNIVGEIQGRKSTRATPDTSPLVGTGSRGEARLGVQIFTGGFRWDVAAIAGLTRRDVETGLSFGVSKTFRGFFGLGRDN